MLNMIKKIEKVDKIDILEQQIHDKAVKNVQYLNDHQSEINPDESQNLRHEIWMYEKVLSMIYDIKRDYDEYGQRIK